MFPLKVNRFVLTPMRDGPIHADVIERHRIRLMEISFDDSISRYCRDALITTSSTSHTDKHNQLPCLSMPESHCLF